MRVIWKYPLPPASPAILELPEGAVLLHVGYQGDGPCLWFHHDTARPIERREFFVYGTGHPIDDDGLFYCGSTQAGSFVWHVFERDLARQLLHAIGKL